MQSIKKDLIPQETYNTILENMPIACVDVVIVHDGGVLLVKRRDKPAQGQWWVPGGRVLKGETMRGTAKRKALEEVGIDCVVGPILHTAETVFPDGPSGIPIHSINSCFFLVPNEKEVFVKLDEHSLEWKWAWDISDDLDPYVQNCLRPIF